MGQSLSLIDLAVVIDVAVAVVVVVVVAVVVTVVNHGHVALQFCRMTS